MVQRVVTSYAAGRAVDLEKILTHELMPVPLSLAEANGSLRTGDKSILINSLTKDIICPSVIPIPEISTIIIDVWGTINALGKPDGAKNFGDLSQTFIQNILKVGEKYERIDLVGDQYQDTSIKSGARERRKRNKNPIRKWLCNGDVPLPFDWGGYLALQDNKTELSNFLME